jgi:hypothetical protein
LWACKPPLETWESSFQLWYSAHGRILHRIVLVSFFLIAAPDRGETIVVRLVMDHVQTPSIFPAFMYS